MKTSHLVILLLLVASSSWLIVRTGNSTPRNEENINLNWHYNKQIVSLPHNTASPATDSSLCFYEKSLDLRPYSDQNQFYLIFDGISPLSKCQINQQFVSKSSYNKGQLSIDISEYIHRDSLNHIKISTPRGSGIYGKASLIACKRLHFPPQHTSIHTELSNDTAITTYQITLKNNSRKFKRYKLRSDLLDPDGHLIRTSIISGAIKGRSSRTITENHLITSPRIWTSEAPSRYEIRSFLIHKKRMSDQCISSFTIAPEQSIDPSLPSIYFNEAFPALGQAHNEATVYYQLKLLKKAGINQLIIPNSHHNIITKQCDLLGFNYIKEQEYNDSLYFNTYKLNTLFEANASLKPFSYYLGAKSSQQAMAKLAVSKIVLDSLTSESALMSHWNIQEKDQVEVYLFSNCDSAKLYLNDSLLVSYTTDMLSPCYSIQSLNFKAGILKIEAYKNGAIAADSLCTATKPTRIQLVSDKDEIVSDGNDMLHIESSITDSLGIVDPYSNKEINYTVEGSGEIKLIQNGDTTELHGRQASARVNSGRHLLLIQSTLLPGDITINAQASGLEQASIKVKSSN